MWPALYLRDAPFGTCYIRPHEFPPALERHRYAGQGWKFRGEWTTYRPNQHVSYKNVMRLSPADEADFSSIMGGCEAARMLNPPTSFTDCFLHLYHSPFPPWSSHCAMYGRSFGGWMRGLDIGPHRKKVWAYDINKAYRWAALQGLPDMRTAFRIYNLSDFRAHEWHPAIFLGSVSESAFPLGYGGSREPLRIFTSEELQSLGIVPEKIVWAIGFRDMVDLSRVFASVDRTFPHCRERVSRAFWGMWNATKGPMQVTWKSGHRERQLKNPFYNPVWAAYVTSRVKLRLWEHRSRMLACQTDTIFTTEPIETGENVGEWRSVREYEKGVWVRAGGMVEAL